MDLKKYLVLKERVEKAQRDADRATGALDQLKSQLKKEFGCNTIKEAETLLAKLTKENARMVGEFDKALASFEGNWSKELEA